MKNTLVYDHYSNTIRQNPQNYLIGYKSENGGWICNPDLAADKELCMEFFKETLSYDGRYATTLELIRKYNKDEKYIKV